jgi:hypothetical protein
MPKRKETDRVTFIAEYRDGSVARFDIDPLTLRNGHWVARIIARERQEQGGLEPGEIVRATLTHHTIPIVGPLKRPQERASARFSLGASRLAGHKTFEFGLGATCHPRERLGSDENSAMIVERAFGVVSVTRNLLNQFAIRLENSAIGS